MKRIFALASVALALVLTACAPATAAITAHVPAVGTSALHNTTVDEKALIEAELAYAIPADAYLIAVKGGLITGGLKANAKATLQLAKSVLDTARAAYDLGDARTMGDQIAAAKRVIDRAKLLIPASALAAAQPKP